MRCLDLAASFQSWRIAAVVLAVFFAFSLSLAIIAMIDAHRMRRKIEGFDAASGSPPRAKAWTPRRSPGAGDFAEEIANLNAGVPSDWGASSGSGLSLGPR